MAVLRESAGALFQSYAVEAYLELSAVWKFLRRDYCKKYPRNGVTSTLSSLIRAIRIFYITLGSSKRLGCMHNWIHAVSALSSTFGFELSLPSIETGSELSALHFHSTIGAFGGKRHGYYNGVDILKELRDDEGYVINCPQDISEIFKSCSKDAKPGSPCLTDQDASENFRGCDDTSRSPVVHQWDRHAHILGRFIEARISCKAGNWYAQLSQL